MSNRPQSAEPSRAIAERRNSPRLRIPSLGYVELGKNNGGILLNVGEGGLAVASATPLSADSVGQMRFQIPGSRDWIEANGELAWLSESKREAGIRFVDLPDDARERIRAWISSPGSVPPTKTSPVREKAWRRLDTATLTMPTNIADARPLQSSQSADTEPFPEGQFGERVPIYGLPTHRIFLKLLANDLKALFRAMTRGWGAVATLVAIAGLITLGYVVGKARKANAALVRDALAQSESISARSLGNDSNFSGQDASTSATDASNLSPTASRSSNALQGSSSSGSANGDSARSNQPLDSNPDPDIERMRQHLAEAESHLRSSAAATPGSEPFTRSSSSASHSADGSLLRNASAPPLPETNTSAVTNAAPPVSTPPASQPAASVSVVPAPPPKPAPPKNTISVSINGLPSIRVPEGLKSQSSSGGAALQIGQLLSRVDPVYPPEAEAQRVEGTVQMHVVIGADGMIESVQPKSGPPLLIPAAVSAVRQWSYTPSFVAGQPAQAEEDIAITFRLAR